LESLQALAAGLCRLGALPVTQTVALKYQIGFKALTVTPSRKNHSLSSHFSIGRLTSE